MFDANITLCRGFEMLGLHKYEVIDARPESPERGRHGYSVPASLTLHTLYLLGRFFSRSAMARQHNHEDASLTIVALDGDVAVMTFDNHTHDSESQSLALEAAARTTMSDL